MNNLTKAMNYLKVGQFRKAKEFYLKALEENPNLALAHQGLAECFLEENLVDEAYASSREALELDPKLTMPLIMLARIYIKRKQYDEAEEILLKVLDRDPSDAAANIVLAIAYLAQNKKKVGIDTLHKAVALNPKGWKTHYDLGVVYSWQNLRQEAFDEFWLALKLNPTGKTVNAVLETNLSLNRLWYVLAASTAVAIALIVHSIFGLFLILIPAAYSFILSYVWFRKKNYKFFLLDILLGILLIGGYLLYSYRLPPLF